MSDYFISHSERMEGAFELDPNLSPELIQAVLGATLKLAQGFLMRDNMLAGRPSHDSEAGNEAVLEFIKELVDEEIEMNNAVGDYSLASMYFGVKPDVATGQWAAFAPVSQEA